MTANREWATGYKPSWYNRATQFILPTGGSSCRIWRKRDLPENTEFLRLYEMPGDDRAWFSPDGNWNCDPYPLFPRMSYDDAFRYFSGLVIAPTWDRIRIGEERFYQIEMWQAATSDPFWTWHVEEEWEGSETALKKRAERQGAAGV
jgi:hypothetical protein